MNAFITVAALFGFVGQLSFLYNFFYSIFKGKTATQNPWNSNTLEWTTPVNPGHGNWPGEIPSVYRWPYDYSKPGVNNDYLPQHIPDAAISKWDANPAQASLLYDENGTEIKDTPAHH
jgi:cytochrome c oxidase subunit 1